MVFLSTAAETETLKPIVTIDQKIAEFFNSNFGLGGDWTWGNLILIAISLILTVVLCTFVGMERERRGRSAGLRTHLLVGLGSAIVMIISIYGFPAFGADRRDVARLAAGVITGVGFLGAGAIIHNQASIKGLTTASTIWLAMAIGLACGSMNFTLAILSCIIVMVILVSFRKIEKAITRSNKLFVVLSKPDTPIMTELLTVAKELGYTVNAVTSQIIQSGSETMVETTFKLGSEKGKEVIPEEFITKLSGNEGIKSVQVLNSH